MIRLLLLLLLHSFFNQQLLPFISLNEQLLLLLLSLSTEINTESFKDGFVMNLICDIFLRILNYSIILLYYKILLCCSNRVGKSTTGGQIKDLQRSLATSGPRCSLNRHNLHIIYAGEQNLPTPVLSCGSKNFS